MNPHEPTEAELHAEAQDLENLAAQLRAELQAEPAFPLREEQRAAIFAAAANKVTSGPQSWWRRGSLIGAAAGLAVGVLSTATVLQMQHLHDLRTMVGQPRTAEARGLSIHLLDEPTLSAAPEEVTAPAPGQPVVATQATPPAIRLELPSFPSAPVLPPAPTVSPVRSSLAGEPASVVSAPRVDPASIPFVGHAPKDLPRSAVKDRAAAKASPTPKR